MPPSITEKYNEAKMSPTSLGGVYRFRNTGRKLKSPASLKRCVEIATQFLPLFLKNIKLIVECGKSY